MDANVRSLIRSGAPLLMAWDAHLQSPEATQDPSMAWYFQAQDSPQILGQGHFVWLKSMEEKGCPPMQMLQAATRNIAVAYGKGRDLGTIEPGKMADMLVLDKNPLEAADNYRTILQVIKAGTVVDRDALPANPILTNPLAPPAAEEASYIPFLSPGKFPSCGCR